MSVKNLLGISQEGLVLLISVLDFKKLNLINYFECSKDSLGLEIKKRKLEKSKTGIVLNSSQAIQKELAYKSIKIPNHYLAEYISTRLYQEQGVDPKQWVMDFEYLSNKSSYLIYLAKRPEIKVLENFLRENYLEPVLAEPELISQSRFEFENFKILKLPERFYLSGSVAIGIKAGIKKGSKK